MNELRNAQERFYLLINYLFLILPKNTFLLLRTFFVICMVTSVEYAVVVEYVQKLTILQTTEWSGIATQKFSQHSTFASSNN